MQAAFAIEQYHSRLSVGERNRRIEPALTCDDDVVLRFIGVYQADHGGRQGAGASSPHPFPLLPSGRKGRFLDLLAYLGVQINFLRF
jgi:hypothetical protein